MTTLMSGRINIRVTLIIRLPRIVLIIGQVRSPQVMHLLGWGKLHTYQVLGVGLHFRLFPWEHLTPTQPINLEG